MAMTSSRPYILRALYEWILDNGCTPYLLVNAMAEGTLVPEQHVKDGQIVLNISPTAVVNLELADEAINFNGRFGGVPQDIYVPMAAIMGIYARENGQGMVFDVEDSNSLEPPPPSPGDSPKRGSRPSLRVIK